jgi:2-polyprenyl-3-methyl-5-hydroxy-6-metoxy-1,4-benzoquinol methylase
MQADSHWQDVYLHKPIDTVSWFQSSPGLSLQLIAEAGLAADDPLIDVGGGASVLVDELLRSGHRKVTVLDLAPAALQASQQRLGSDAGRVDWISGDITEVSLPAAHYALWHDRAVFHFLTEPAQRAAYRAQLLHALRPDGHLLIATFAEDGPTRCSGLPVQRYSAESLQAEFGEAFTLRRTEREAHRTPSGAEQRFVYLLLQRRG